VESDTTVSPFLRVTVRLIRPLHLVDRTRLEPGEGLWFPPSPPLFDGWTHDNTTSTYCWC